MSSLTSNLSDHVCSYLLSDEAACMFLFFVFRQCCSIRDKVSFIIPLYGMFDFRTLYKDSVAFNFLSIRSSLSRIEYVIHISLLTQYFFF